MLRPVICVFVAAAAALVGCDGAGGDESPPAKVEKQHGPKHDGGREEKREARKAAEKGRFKLGRIDHKAITESSGLAASRQHPGVFWTHNDSGSGPFIFAITREGKFLAEYPVSTVRNTDWEAIAADDQGHLYVADTGNNELKRDRALVYRLDEPDPAAAGPSGRGASLKVSQVWRLKYPDKPFDAESLAIYQGKGYVISKLLTGKNAGLYSFDLADSGEEIALQHVCDLPIRSPVTDACISDDGKRLAVMTVTGPNLFDVGGDPANACNVEPAHVTYFDPGDMNMEGVCFVPEGLLASTEQGQMLLFLDGYFAKPGAGK
jgi:hypothetical protein